MYDNRVAPCHCLRSRHICGVMSAGRERQPHLLLMSVACIAMQLVGWVLCSVVVGKRTTLVAASTSNDGNGRLKTALPRSLGEAWHVDSSDSASKNRANS